MPTSSAVEVRQMEREVLVVSLFFNRNLSQFDRGLKADGLFFLVLM